MFLQEDYSHIKCLLYGYQVINRQGLPIPSKINENKERGSFSLIVGREADAVVKIQLDHEFAVIRPIGSRKYLLLLPSVLRWPGEILISQLSASISPPLGFGDVPVADMQNFLLNIVP